MATATNDKPVRLGDLPVVKTNILENARQYDKGIIGGYNGTFPLTAATKGNIYLLPTTNKFYMCITNYNGSNLTAPNANFEELSVWANRDKLENLTKSATYEFNIDKLNIKLFKIGNVVSVISKHQGGIEDAQLPAGTVPKQFKPLQTAYMSIARISGSPALIFYPDGSVALTKNGAIIQDKTETTFFYHNDCYISR